MKGMFRNENYCKNKFVCVSVSVHVVNLDVELNEDKQKGTGM